MSSTTITLIVLGVIAILLVFAVIGIYNKLVTLKNRFENGFSQIEVQLQRRYDLIPNLIETVKGYMAHEKETLEAVIQARNQAQSSLQAASQNPGDAAAIAGLAGAEGMLGGALGRIFALSESYPDLKANQNMANLQEELSSTENKVAFLVRLSTTRSRPTTLTSKLSLQSFSRECLVTDRMEPCSNSKAKKSRKPPRFSFNFTR
jgi:LemA protein